MSSGAFYGLAAAGVGFACAVAAVGMRALRHAKTVDVFEQPPQQYMLQVHPPSHNVQAISLPVRRVPDAERQHEKQA